MKKTFTLKFYVRDDHKVIGVGKDIAEQNFGRIYVTILIINQIHQRV